MASWAGHSYFGLPPAHVVSVAMGTRGEALRLHRAPSGEEVHDQYGQREDQQEVDQSTANMSQEAENPDNNQDHDHGPEE